MNKIEKIKNYQLACKKNAENPTLVNAIKEHLTLIEMRCSSYNIKSNFSFLNDWTDAQIETEAKKFNSIIDFFDGISDGLVKKTV